MTHHDQPARGILRGKGGVPPFTHARYPPSAATKSLVEFFWSVTWRLPEGETFSQRVLSHPSVHVVWEPTRLYLSGIPTACFERHLEGEGDVFSAKILPGHASRLLPSSARDYTDRELPLDKIWTAGLVSAFRGAMRDCADAQSRIARFEEVLCDRAEPAQTEHILCEQITRFIESHPEVRRVAEVSEHFDEHPRTLQRLFARHVGISLKWIIGRYRMHEAAMHLDSGGEVSLTELAHALGYYDQAHFARDFKKLTGQTPSSYRAQSP